MSEYSLKCKYSLVGFHTLIMYDIINGRCVKMGILSLLTLFLLLSIQQTNNKKVLMVYDLTKPVPILQYTNRELIAPFPSIHLCVMDW